MNDYRNIPLYRNSQHTYELVYFEDKRAWHICCTDLATENQTWSVEGYDTPAEGTRAFDGAMYTDKVPE